MHRGPLVSRSGLWMPSGRRSPGRYPREVRRTSPTRRGSGAGPPARCLADQRAPCAGDGGAGYLPGAFEVEGAVRGRGTASWRRARDPALGHPYRGAGAAGAGEPRRPGHAPHLYAHRLRVRREGLGRPRQRAGRSKPDPRRARTSATRRTRLYFSAPTGCCWSRAPPTTCWTRRRQWCATSRGWPGWKTSASDSAHRCSNPAPMQHRFARQPSTHRWACGSVSVARSRKVASACTDC